MNENFDRKVGIDIHVPFVEHLGICMIEKSVGAVRLSLNATATLENSWGSLHGGVIMTLLDVALASAGRSLDASCEGAITVELKTNFLAIANGTVYAQGRAQRAGRVLIFSEGEVVDEKGSILAKGTGTFKLIYPRENR